MGGTVSAKTGGTTLRLNSLENCRRSLARVLRAEDADLRADRSDPSRTSSRRMIVNGITALLAPIGTPRSAKTRSDSRRWRRSSGIGANGNARR